MKNKEGSVTEYYAIHRNFTFCIIYFFAPERHTATKPTSWFSIYLTMAPRLSNIQKQILIEQGCQEREKKESKVNAHEGQVRQYSKSTRVLHCLWLEHDWLPVWGLPYDFRSNEGKRQVYEAKTYFGITDEIWKAAETDPKSSLYSKPSWRERIQHPWIKTIRFGTAFGWAWKLTRITLPSILDRRRPRKSPFRIVRGDTTSRCGGRGVD